MNEKTKKLLSISDKILTCAKPISLNILLTYQCNFSCKHCYIEPERIENCGKLSVDKWKEILQFFKKIGTIYLRISGGEPTISPLFEEIYNFAWDLGFKIEIATNGYVLNRYFNLLAIKKPYLITFSLYGLNDSTYNEFCHIKSKGFYNLIVSIQYCENNNINFRINYILTSYNSKQMPKIYELAKNKKWNINCLRNLQIDTAGGIEPIQCQASIEDIIKSYYIFNDGRKKFLHFKDSVWLKGYKTCYSGITHFNINPYGEMYLCAACFSIKTQLNNNYLDAIKQIRTYRCNQIEKENKCSSCELKYWCGICTPIYKEKIFAEQFDSYCNDQKKIYYALRRDFMVKYKLKYRYEFSEVDGDFIVTPLNGEMSTKALVVNESTYKILMSLQKFVTISDIVELFEEQYAVSNTELFNDVKSIIDELEQAELIERNDV